jgi:hypothetical protein
MAELEGYAGTIGPTRRMSETRGECGHDILGPDAARTRCRAGDLVTPSRWDKATVEAGKSRGRLMGASAAPVAGRQLSPGGLRLGLTASVGLPIWVGPAACCVERRFGVGISG